MRLPLQRTALLLAVLGGVGCSEGPRQGATDSGAPARAPAAHLESVKGEVKLERDGKLAPARLGYLYVGDAIETQESAEAGQSVKEFADRRDLPWQPVFRHL